MSNRSDKREKDTLMNKNIEKVGFTYVFLNKN